MQVSQTEKCKSEKQMLADFCEAKFSKHLASGRITWQEDPCTAGVYQYKDTADWHATRVMNRDKRLKQERQQEGVDSIDDEFEKIWGGLNFSKAAFASTDAWMLTDSKGTFMAWVVVDKLCMNN